jgi:hypothetical protein
MTMPRTILVALTTLGLLLSGGVSASASPVDGSTASVPLSRPAVVVAHHRDYRSSPAVFATSTVGLYGDSITYQTWRGLTHSFPRMAVDAWWGRDITRTVDVLIADTRKHAPRFLVLAAGTNNLSSPATVRYQIRRARLHIPASTRLLWVDVYTPRYPTLSAAVNRAAQGIPGVIIVPWSAASSAYDPALVFLDGLHVTTFGANLRNSIIRRAILGAS